MARDRQLSRNLWLHEFTGWQDASEPQVDRLAETVARALQPIRSAMGVPMLPTTWLAWRDGTARVGSHAYGAVDFVMEDGRTREAYEWAERFLVPSGYIGRLIYEPERSAAEGVPQGEHIHLAPVQAMVDHVGDPTIKVLEETTEGTYVFYEAAAALGLGVLALGALFFFRCAGRPRSERFMYRNLSLASS
jgi:hypothetical protein